MIPPATPFFLFLFLLFSLALSHPIRNHPPPSTQICRLRPPIYDLMNFPSFFVSFSGGAQEKGRNIENERERERDVWGREGWWEWGWTVQVSGKGVGQLGRSGSQPLILIVFLFCYLYKKYCYAKNTVVNRLLAGNITVYAETCVPIKCKNFFKMTPVSTVSIYVFGHLLSLHLCLLSCPLVIMSLNLTCNLTVSNV